MRYLVTLALFLLLFPCYEAMSFTIPMQATVAHAQEVLDVNRETSTSTVDMLIKKYAQEYGVPYVQMNAVVSCETGGTYSPIIQSFAYQNGVRENSWGLAQIHLPDWPNITKEEAEDPDFSLDFLASHISKGQGFYWTCYRNLYQ